MKLDGILALKFYCFTTNGGLIKKKWEKGGLISEKGKTKELNRTRVFISFLKGLCITNLGGQWVTEFLTSLLDLDNFGSLFVK